MTNAGAWLTETHRQKEVQTRSAQNAQHVRIKASPITCQHKAHMCAPGRTNDTPAQSAGIQCTVMHSSTTHTYDHANPKHTCPQHGGKMARQHRVQAFIAQSCTASSKAHYCKHVRSKQVQFQGTTRRTKNIPASTRRTHVHAQYEYTIQRKG